MRGYLILLLTLVVATVFANYDSLSYVAKKVYVKSGAVPLVGFIVRGEKVSLLLMPSGGPMLRGQVAYFYALTSDIKTDTYITPNGWEVVEVSFDTALTSVRRWWKKVEVIDPNLVLEKKIKIATNGKVALVILTYINHSPETLTLERYFSHIHEGTDGITISIVPKDFSVEDNGKYKDGILELLRRTYLIIGNRNYGTFSSLGLWESLPPGEVKLRIGDYEMCIMSVNELSTSKLIQIVTNYQYLLLGDRSIVNELDFQHSTVTLRPNEAARYVYAIGLSDHECRKLESMPYYQLNELVRKIESPSQIVVTTTVTTLRIPITIVTTVEVPVTLTVTVRG